MSNKHTLTDYDPVTPSSRARRVRDGAPEDSWPTTNGTNSVEESFGASSSSSERREAATETAEERPAPADDAATDADAAANLSTPQKLKLKRGHALSYAGLFFFTVVLYFRPYELFPALSGLTSLAYWVAILTFAVFVPTQFALEGNLTARPREVNLVLLLCVAALLSIPLAINPAEAWAVFNYPFIRAVAMFIVIVNVLRTPLRLKGLMLLGIIVGVFLSVSAINDYRLGRVVVEEGERVTGVIGGMFGNPNDLALHLVMMIPLAVGLLMSTRNVLAKPLYAASAFLMVGGVIVSFSRGGFLGLLGAGMVLAWKLGRSNRFIMIVLTGVLFVALIAVAPGEYTDRLSTIGSVNADASSSSRRALLERSIIIALYNPLFGVGIGNFHIVSLNELVSHNAYTQVAAEMGLAAMVIYIMLLVVPFRRLRLIEAATFESRRGSRIYYLSVTLQASLVAYMISSFFGSVAYQFYVYYLVGYAVALRRIYEAETGIEVIPLSKKEKRARAAAEAGRATDETSPLDSTTDFPQPESRHAHALRTGA